MALITVQPTANQTPDATLGGVAVTTPSNTGHASTTTSASGGGSQTKSCRWFTIPAFGGQAKSVTLKIDHTSSGVLTGPTPSNIFQLEYSVNGGGSWTSAVSRTNFTASQGPTTFSVALSASQNPTQVQVRVKTQVDTVDVTDAGSTTTTIANIKLEITTIDAGVIVMM